MQTSVFEYFADVAAPSQIPNAEHVREANTPLLHTYKDFPLDTITDEHILIR